MTKLIVVAIGKEVSKSLTEDLLTLRSYLIEQNYPFIIEIVPSESDMMIVYDARDMIKHHNIQSPFFIHESTNRIDSFKHKNMILTSKI